MTHARPQNPDAGGFVGPLSEQSNPGVYVVVTASRSLYAVEIVSPDLPPQVTRHPAQGPLLGDGEPLPGVSGFVFDVETGVGQILWWKESPGDYDRSDAPYGGTIRTTNAVLFIGRLGDRTPLAGMGIAEDLDWDAVVEIVRATVRARHPDDRDPQ